MRRTFDGVVRGARTLLVAGMALVASACTTAGESTRSDQPEERRTTSAAPSPTSSAEPAPSAVASAEPGPESDGMPQDALLTIPKLGIRDLPVEAYRGWTDDAPGTEIQDGGIAASPHGPRGGVGPGGIGNYQVTAHRLSSTQAFLDLPDLRQGDRVRVAAGGVTYVYRIVGTRDTSFRSEQSLREQRAAVPGRPGEEPAQAMITLSTCATIEDRAEGNYWSDEFGNPEHRIDKVGVLIGRR